MFKWDYLGDGLFVAVGFDIYLNGFIITSPDLLQWADQSTRNAMGGVAWGGGSFVVIGAHGDILNSPRGEVWSRPSAGPAYLLKVTWSGGLFFAVGTNGHIITSLDGKSWSEVATMRDESLTGLVCGDGFYVAVGHGSKDSVILTSQDGESWLEASSVKDVLLSGVSWGDGLFVAVGYTYDTGGVILTSQDGKNWSEAETVTGTWFTGVTYGNGFFVAVGAHGVILTSPDGRKWTRVVSVTDRVLYSVAWGDGLFVAVGEGMILTSLDGETWSKIDVAKDAWLRDVIWAESRFFIVGNERRHYDSGVILTSTDGEVWSTIEGAFPSAGSVAWGDGRLVVVFNVDGHELSTVCVYTLAEEPDPPLSDPGLGEEAVSPPDETDLPGWLLYLAIGLIALGAVYTSFALFVRKKRSGDNSIPKS